MLEAIQRVLVEARRPVRSSAWLEDLRWIYSNESQHPFSFLCVAAILNLDPEWIRDRIYRALSRGDPLAAPTLAQGLKRCRLAGLISLDEAKTRRQRQELVPAA